MNFASLRLVLLDCDGVLFDSWDANVAYYDTILVAMGEPPLDDVGREHAHRMSTRQIFAWVFPDDSELQARAHEIARETSYRPFLERMKPVPALFETLSWLRERYKTGLATNRGGTIPMLLERFGLAQYFDQVVGTYDVTHPKPSPEMLELCLARLEVPPAQAVYVGDSPGDKEAAAAAGIPFIAVGEAVDARISIGEIGELPGRLMTF